MRCCLRFIYLQRFLLHYKLNVPVLQCTINTFSSYSSCCSPHYVTITAVYNPLSMSVSPGNMGNDDSFTTYRIGRARQVYCSFFIQLFSLLFPVLC